MLRYFITLCRPFCTIASKLTYFAIRWTPCSTICRHGMVNINLKLLTCLHVNHFWAPYVTLTTVQYHYEPLSTVAWNVANRMPLKATWVPSRVTVVRCEQFFAIYILLKNYNHGSFSLIDKGAVAYQVWPRLLGVNSTL